VRTAIGEGSLGSNATSDPQNNIEMMVETHRI
jgi:hypothetical protein